MSNFNQLSGAIRFALLAGAASTFAAVPAFAQDSEEDTATLETIEVTGSRIKRADLEGALPVTVIDRAQIDASGEVSVADYLRNTTFNSFGSFRPQSGSSAQANAGVSLRGLGSGRTLLLIDGRRAPVAAATGNFQDINTIPLAAVERIEILSDGASAIYGSDAIGGVINIITRKDFNGAEFSYGRGMPSRAGGDTENASIIFGASSDRGRVLAGVSMNDRDIVFQRDRPWSSGGVSSFSNEYYFATPAAGTLYGFRAGTTIAHPTNGAAVPTFDCTTNGFFETGSGAASRCLYDFTFVAADEAQVKNLSTFIRADYQINDNWSTYMNATVTRINSFGRYAPVPSSPWPGGSIFIPADSPNHPANINPADPYYATLAGQPVFLRHRFAALGNRDNQVEANTYDFMTGFQGRIGAVDIDVGARYTENKAINLGRGYVVASLAAPLIADGTYDITDPFGVDPAIAAQMITTTARESTTIQKEVYGIASFDLFQMAGGTASMAFGAEYREEDWSDVYDSLSSAGSVSGSSGNSAFGLRDVKAVYFEALFPLVDTLEINVAGRFDEYSDYGNDFAPKVALRWQPLDSLTFRASYGQGFRAPTLDIVGQQPAFGADGIADPATCVAFGLGPACSTQVTSYTIANPNVTSEQSTQFSLGAAWDATDWLNLTLDYYDIEIEDQLAFFDTAALVDCISGVSSVCPTGVSVLPSNQVPPVPSLGLGVARDPVSGAILYSQIGYANLGTIETSGFDFNLRTNFDMGSWGEMRNALQIAYVRDYDVNNAGSIVGDQGSPEFRANLMNQWTFGDFAVTWNINHIDGTRSSQAELIEAFGPAADYGYALTLPSWTTHDVQLTWNAPWNGRLSLGVNNLTDKDPVLDPLDAGGRGFNFNLYDGYGRVTYINYTQTF